MAWTYNDWATQSTAAARLTRLNLHISEVSAKIGNELSGDGFSKGSNALTQYLNTLMTERKTLENRVDRASQGVIQVKLVDETTNGAGDDRDL